MVQDKRKPIVFEPAKTFPANVHIWQMKGTGEIFQSYEAYLDKLDYYKQKRFTCEITGHTNLTFFEALASETEGSQQIENRFPDQLREPILRKCQFSTISRIDHLVQFIYDTFKDDFFPGERVQVAQEVVGHSVEGTISDKTVFAEQRGADGEIERPAKTNYFVTISPTKPLEREQQAMVPKEQLNRNRKNFSIKAVRAFLRKSITRDRWDGAPWRVKDDLAEKYHIDQTIPSHLQQDKLQSKRKAYAALEKNKPDPQSLQYFAEVEGHIPEGFLAQAIQDGVKIPKHLREELRHSIGSDISLLKGKPGPAKGQPRGVSKKVKEPSPEPPPKYPCEDLEVFVPIRGARPPFQFVQDQTAIDGLDVTGSYGSIDKAAVGPLLEIWNALNIHADTFVLDSFTFDDFLEAMLFSSNDIDCEIFVEAHCAVLKLLVDNEGNLEAPIPELEDSEDEEEEEEEQESSIDDSKASTPPEDSTLTPRKRRMSKIEEEDTPMVDAASEVQVHRAREFVENFDWIDRLKVRDFRNGGWQGIVVGVMHHLAQADYQKAVCNEILSHLVPDDMPATIPTVQRNYRTLNVNLRTATLETLTMLAIPTRAIKDAMEARSEQMTLDRKAKIDIQREKKAIIDTLQELDVKRKMLYPDHVIASNQARDDEANGTTNGATTNGHTAEDQDGTDGEAEPEEEKPRRGRPRKADLKRKREEDAARKEKEKKAKMEAKAERDYKYAVAAVEKAKARIRECEEQIEEYEEALRRNNCPRVRHLGKDRFLNKYYWFERNGMPFEGSDKSSTSGYGYANGRLWVQGPDSMESVGLVDLTEEEEARFRMHAKLEVPRERREKEDGPTRLLNAEEWGFYDDPKEFDKLLGWLDTRGTREKELHKNMHELREKITHYMKQRKEHLDEVAENKAINEEPVIGVATRRKNYIDQALTKYSCLAWTNTLAKKTLGHLHQDEADMKRPKKGVARPKAPAPAPEPRSTRSRR